MSSLIKRVFHKFKIIIHNVLSPENAWLYKNRIERMDANRNDIFEFSRASFHLDRYIFASNYAKGKIVLDAACGTGYGSKIIKEQGKAEKVIGLDNNFASVKYAESKYSSYDITFINASITQLPFSNETFDLVVSFETIEHIAQENEMLNEIIRVLKNNGQLILSTPNDWGVGELAPFHVRSYTLEKLEQTLSPHFAVNEIYNQNSGTRGRKENHGQPRGMVKTNEQNFRLAECYVVIAEKNNLS